MLDWEMGDLETLGFTKLVAFWKLRSMMLYPDGRKSVEGTFLF
jgi:hypothetical protein